MKLRDFLERRELELLEKIAALRNELIPLEGELAEIRRARAAVEDSGGGVPELKRSSLEKILASTWSTHQSDTPLPLRHSALLAALGDPYADLTMKELVMKALREQFSNGATARQMLDFFRDAWGRNIQRQNLSPQISRLYQEGAIGRIRSTRGWFLYEKDGKIVGFRPYLHRERIVWCEPISTDLDYEPLMAQDIEAEVAKDRMPYKRTITTIRSGVTSRQVRLVWLLPHEVTGDDDAASWNEASSPDNEEG